MLIFYFFFFFFNDTATTEIYTLSLHDALPIFGGGTDLGSKQGTDIHTQMNFSFAVEGISTNAVLAGEISLYRSEEHTSELQSQSNIVCRLLLEKKKKKNNT